jgi:Carboxypeptidase regulatory-like domain
MLRLTRSLSLCTSAAALAVLLPAAAQSQIRPVGTGPTPIAPIARGTVDGVVSDTGLVPLQAAFVAILGTKIRVGTGPNGRFRITNVPAGEYLVIVKRVGYHPTSGVVDVPASDTVRLAYTLDKLRPNELETVVITANSPSSRMVGFESRR